MDVTGSQHHRYCSLLRPTALCKKKKERKRKKKKKQTSTLHGDYRGGSGKVPRHDGVKIKPWALSHHEDDDVLIDKWEAVGIISAWQDV